MVLFSLLFLSVSCDYRFSLTEPDGIWNGKYICDGYLQGSSVLYLNSDRSFRYEYDNASENESILPFTEGEFRLHELTRREEFVSGKSINIVYRGEIEFISGMDSSESLVLDFTGRISSDDGTLYIIIGEKEKSRPQFEKEKPVEEEGAE